MTTTPLAPRFSPADSDERLVARAVAGEIEAFEVLVQRYRQIAVRVATRIVGREEAEDVAQDAFLRAYHRLDRFRREAPFRAWLLRIVHNTALNAVTRRVPTPVEDLPIDADPDVGGERTPARHLEDVERRERLALKLDLLRPSHRSVLVLRDIEGMTYDEIAEITEMPIGSVKGRLHRARAEMIDLLRNNTYDWELPEGE